MRVSHQESVLDNLPERGKYSTMFGRNILNNILDALSDTPVVFLRGARQTGKSTLVQEIAGGPYPARYLTLDNAGMLSAASADPAGFIAGIEKPVVIDEAQRVRELFLAIKEDVDRHREPGRYLLTGSADILTLPKVADALAGRMEVLTLWPLSVGEMRGGGEDIISALLGDGFPRGLKPDPNFDLAACMAAGGFPEPAQRTVHRRRRAWFESYITTILDRNIRDLAQIQDLAVVPRLLKLLAGRMGGDASQPVGDLKKQRDSQQHPLALHGTPGDDLSCSVPPGMVPESGEAAGEGSQALHGGHGACLSFARHG